ncbi:MAG TPA: ABC transporter permease, partial [Bryobacteraceae bacterium]|nr:ABC transporter permease [Bryobacteraceae bacterium]
GQPKFGNITLFKEDSRAMWTWTFWEQLGQDLRYALRTMANNKAFTALAALSLALGIGANTAIYSFIDSILLRSLPVQDPQSLVMLNTRSQPRNASPSQAKGKQAKRESVMHSSMTTSGSSFSDPKTGFNAGVFPYPAFELFQKSDSIFSIVFAYYGTGPLNLSIKGQADVANGEYVSGDFFRGLGVPPAAGRLIAGDDDKAGASAVAVVSYSFSQKRFGGAANAERQSILINNVPFTVIGVAPPEFFGVDPANSPDFYLPMRANLALSPGPFISANSYLDGNFYWIEIMARLRPGVSMEQAQATLAPQFQQWVLSTASNTGERSDLPKLLIKEGAGGLDSLRRQYSKPLYVLLTLVGLILAIACANIANLLLSRATARRREMAVRLSMGAGRWRVMRQLLTESVLLASLGGVLGIVFATWGIRVLTALLANGRENFTPRAELNWHVLGVTLALSVLTGVLFGLAPAIQSTHVDVIPALKESRAGGSGGRNRRSFLHLNLSQVLVVSQIAISLLMLVTAGLFVRSLSNLQTIDLGFNRENVLLFELNARQAGHQDSDILTFYSDLQKRFNAMPGVRNATLSRGSLVGGGTMGTIIMAGGVQQASNLVLPVGPSFFTTMQIPMLLGREIEERDQPGSVAVAVVNELFAKTAFGDDNPLGQHISIGRPLRELEIVGVSKTARYAGLKQDNQPVVYIAYNQGAFGQVSQMSFELRTAGNPLNYVNTVREIVHQADPRVPLSNPRTQAAQVDHSINQEIIFARLCTGFALLGLVIACVGLYGTMSYNVARRTNEIGIRMALGAQRGGVIWIVLRQVFVLAIAGLAIGLPVALATSKLVESFLFGMKPDDPLAIGVAVAVLIAAAVLAGYAPARRASKIDPMVALRHE